MKRFEGIAEDVQHSIKTIPNPDSDLDPIETHICRFRVDAQQVELRASRPISITERDKIVFVGELERGQTKCLAWRNVTNNTSGEAEPSWGATIALFTALFFDMLVAVGVYMFIFQDHEFSSLMMSAFFLACAVPAHRIAAWGSNKAKRMLASDGDAAPVVPDASLRKI